MSPVSRNDGEMGRRSAVRSIHLRGLYLQMVEAWVQPIQHRRKEASLGHRLMKSRSLLPLVGRHPVQKPLVGFIVAGYFDVDEHAAA